MNELERLMREALALVRLGPLTKHEHQELDSLMTRAVNALPELLAENAKLRERNASPADGAGEVEAINTNDLRDYADQISNPYAQFILDAASQLDYARTDRNILQAELDAERARRVEVEKALAEVKAGAENTIDFYNRNGPQWTSRETGQEYYSASYVMDSAEETIALIAATLTKDTQDE